MSVFERFAQITITRADAFLPLLLLWLQRSGTTDPGWLYSINACTFLPAKLSIPPKGDGSLRSQKQKGPGSDVRRTR